MLLGTTTAVLAGNNTFLTENISQDLASLFVKIGSKKQLLERFYQLFFRTARLQHQVSLLISIESPNICHWKSANKSKVGVVFGAKFGSS